MDPEVHKYLKEEVGFDSNLLKQLDLDLLFGTEEDLEEIECKQLLIATLCKARLHSVLPSYPPTPFDSVCLHTLIGETKLDFASQLPNPEPEAAPEPPRVRVQPNRARNQPRRRVPHQHPALRRGRLPAPIRTAASNAPDSGHKVRG